MKSNVCLIKKGGLGLEKLLVEVEKVCAYNQLSEKNALRLRLLSEELVGMLPELVKNFDGSFFVENDGDKYYLCVELSVEGMTMEKKEALIAVSRNKKNAAAKGFMGRIRDIAQNMLLSSDEGGSLIDSYKYMPDYAMDMYGSYSHTWSLEYYTEKLRKDGKDKADNEWDELEKSIVAKLADDVIVGVKGSRVNIIIVKKF